MLAPLTADACRVVDTAGLARLIAARDDGLRVARRRRGEIVNEYRGQGWDGHTLPALPFAVYLASGGSYRTLAFDLDASRGDAAADATVLRALLSECGVRCVEAASGPGGGRHVIATFRDPLPATTVAALARRLASILPTLDVTPLCNPATGCIRPPGSPHRAGGTSVLLAEPAAAVAALAAGNSRGTFDRLCARVGVPAQAPHRHPPPSARVPRPLSPAIERLQRDGDVDRRWPDRSGPAAAVCLGYVEAGRPFPEFLRAAVNPTNRGLDHLRRVRVGPGRYRPRREPEIRAAAERMWRGRVRYAEQHPGAPTAAGHLDAQIAAVLADAEAIPSRWAGQGGPSDLAALRAVAHLVATRRAPVVSAGSRTVSELTGCTQSTADRALRRLTRDGWLIRVTPGQGTDAATYRLATPARPGDRTSISHGQDVGGSLAPAPPTTDRLRTAITIQSHDVMTHEGLGRHAAAVKVALTAQAGTGADLARRTGLTRRTVSHQLARLAAVGLARRKGSSWAAADLAELDRAAARLGVTGTVARRAAAHAAQRATWRWLQAESPPDPASPSSAGCGRRVGRRCPAPIPGRSPRCRSRAAAAAPTSPVVFAWSRRDTGPPPRACTASSTWSPSPARRRRRLHPAASRPAAPSTTPPRRSPPPLTAVAEHVQAPATLPTTTAAGARGRQRMPVGTAAARCARGAVRRRPRRRAAGRPQRRPPPCCSSR